MALLERFGTEGGDYAYSCNAAADRVSLCGRGSPERLKRRD